MKRVVKILCGIAVAGALLSAGSVTAQIRPNVERHVYTLASDSLAGRSAGSPEAAKAAGYIAAEFAEIGLKPYYDTTSYFHYFSVGGEPTTIFHNVVGMIEGNDPQLKQEYIIIGAHYDHLGSQGNKIYYGADDNASGTAALIELARMVSSRRNELKRTVIFAAFDGEELGLYGSTAMANALSAEEIERVKLMVSMDMVGWLKANGKLEIKGVGTLKDGRNLINSMAVEYGAPDLDLKNFETFLFGATDTEGFAQRGVPTLHVTTGMKSPYHKPEDTADKIDYDGLSEVTRYMGNTTIAMSADENLTASGRLSFKHRHRLCRFQGGLTAGYGNANIQYKSASFNGKKSMAYFGGAWIQYNFGRFGLRPEIVYESQELLYPREEDFFGEGRKVSSEAVTIPMALVWRIIGISGINMSLDFGGYYSFKVNERWNENPATKEQEWGLTYGFTFNLYKYSFGFTARNGMSDLFTGAPKAHRQSSYFTVGYMF